MKLAFKNKP